MLLGRWMGAMYAMAAVELFDRRVAGELLSQRERESTGRDPKENAIAQRCNGVMEYTWGALGCISSLSYPRGKPRRGRGRVVAAGGAACSTSGNFLEPSRLPGFHVCRTSTPHATHNGAQDRPLIARISDCSTPFDHTR